MPNGTNTQTHAEKTSAIDKVLGFDFQYYYFLYRLIGLTEGETVGLEVKDDVHTELSNDRQVLVQLKHTVGQNADGSPRNLTELDSDLWKTIFNWCSIIQDKNDGRVNKNEQINFIKKTDFLLSTNKSINDSNKFIALVYDYKFNKKTIDDITSYLNDLSEKSDNLNIQKYIKILNSLDIEIKEAFLGKLDFEFGNNDIIQKCKIAIKGKMVPESKIDDVFRHIDSRIREDNFLRAKGRDKLIVSFDDYYRNYHKIYDLARNEKLLIRKFETLLPDKLDEQLFIRQLIDIGDIYPDDVESMAEFTTHKLKLHNNMSKWISEGELAVSEKDDLENEAIVRWSNSFRKHHKKNDGEEKDVIAKSNELLNELRSERLPLSGQELPTDMSNGEFYHLSELLKIGWHKKWKEMYK